MQDWMPVKPEEVAQRNSPETVRNYRPLGDLEFNAKLEMTKVFSDTAKSYVQISSAALVLPLLFREAMLGKSGSDSGLLGSFRWELRASSSVPPRFISPVTTSNF